MKPSRLVPSFRERIWGSTELEPWFPGAGSRIGEVWFEHPEPLPILVKFLFASEDLSVQVHPDDDYARTHENSCGKAEMWHVLRAAPGAKIGLGFCETTTREKLREGALSGEILNLLRWFPAAAGQTYFTPARTVHAIGAGVAICEIQQNSDVTYRLYDYGRGRELHLERALEVADLGPHPGPAPPAKLNGNRELLARCRYFATELERLTSEVDSAPDASRFELLIVLEGRGAISGERFQAGEVWHVPARARAFRLSPDVPTTLLRTYVP